MRKYEPSPAIIRGAATQALSQGNPYKTRATVFYIGTEPRYIYAGQVMTAGELDSAYIETAQKDFTAGYKDRAAGYYDKWYRYNHADEGRAYDIGVRAAANRTDTPEEMHIIPA